MTIIKGSKKWKKEMYKDIQKQWKERDRLDFIKKEGCKVAKFWATQQEVKQKLKDIYEEDERKAISCLASVEDKPSQSSRMFLNWNLDRSKVKKILRSMADDRKLQTTFGNLIGGTRFKTANKGKLNHTICPKCKENIDTWRHCVKCHELKVGEIGNEKQWLGNIRQIIEKISTETPGKYTASETAYVWEGKQTA